MYQENYDYLKLAPVRAAEEVEELLRTRRVEIEIERQRIFDWLMKDGAIVPALTVSANAYAAWRAMNEAYIIKTCPDTHTSENLEYVERVYRRTRKTMDALGSKPEVVDLPVAIRCTMEMTWAEHYGAVIFEMFVDYGDAVTNEIIVLTVRNWRDAFLNRYTKEDLK